MRETNKQLTPLNQLLMEQQVIQNRCREIEWKIMNDVQYVNKHAGEWAWERLSAVSVPEKTALFPFWLRRIWQLIRPMTYYWLGDLGWHLFKLWFRRLFKKKKQEAI